MTVFIDNMNKINNISFQNNDRVKKLGKTDDGRLIVGVKDIDSDNYIKSTIPEKNYDSFEEYVNNVQDKYGKLAKNNLQKGSQALYAINIAAATIGAANYKSMMQHKDKFHRLSYIKQNIQWKQDNVESRGKVAITGKLSVKRSVFEADLRAHGWIPGSISKDTSYLITDDPNSSSDKNRKADQWKIVKISEEEFRNKFLDA